MLARRATPSRRLLESQERPFLSLMVAKIQGYRFISSPAVPKMIKSYLLQLLPISAYTANRIVQG